MRPTCIECVAKHVGSALVLLSETLHGYPDHLILAIGELEQAVQECEIGYPTLSEQIREVRKDITSSVPAILLEKSSEARAKLLDDISYKLSDLRHTAMSRLMFSLNEGKDITPSSSV
jgi:hypothetical protein